MVLRFIGSASLRPTWIVICTVRRSPAVKSFVCDPNQARPARRLQRAIASVVGGEPMPYNKISDLPKEQVDQYSHHQKEAFLAAFNSAYEEYGHDESRAFAVPHSAAQRAPKIDRDGDRN